MDNVGNPMINLPFGDDFGDGLSFHHIGGFEHV
jgi:hypothetical protein